MASFPLSLTTLMRVAGLNPATLTAGDRAAGLLMDDEWVICTSATTHDGDAIAHGERVRPDHPAVLANRESFKEYVYRPSAHKRSVKPTKAKRGVQAPVAATAPQKRHDGPSWYLGETWPPPLDVEYRATTSARVVKLDKRARESVVFESRASRDGTEVGGCLFGPRPWSWRALTVSIVGDPGPGARREVGRFGRDHEHDISLGQQLSRMTEGEQVELGHYHTHPDHGDTMPSDHDMRSWAAMVEISEKRGHGEYLGIIVTPDVRSGWGTPHLTGYIVSRNDLVPERFVCRPVDLG